MHHSGGSSHRFFSLVGRLSVLISILSLFSFAQTTDFIPISKKESERNRLIELAERKKLANAGVYSVSSIRYAYRFGKVEKNGLLESTIRYDDRGNKIREIIYNVSDGSVSEFRNYRYDKQGNLTEESVKKEAVSLKTIHRYNSRNNRIETVHYRGDGTVERKLTFVYDDNGLLLETIGKLDDGRMFMRDSYLYDARGNVIEFKNNLKRITAQYDPRGNITVITKYQRYFKAQDSVQYKLNERFMFDYDANERLAEMRSYRADSSLKSRTQYMRNEKGSLLEEKEYTGDGKLSYSRILKYDKQQNLVEESGTDRALKFKNTYKYDSRGVKTEMVMFDQVNEPVSVIRYSLGRNGALPAVQSSSASIAQNDTSFDEEEEPGTKEEFFQLLGARIIAPDGTYLGMIVADTSNQQSIINISGPYGSSESSTSIFHQTTPYGGEKGIFSPFNPQSPSPPSIYKDGKFFTYLTENDAYRPRSSPRRLIEFVRTLAKQN